MKRASVLLFLCSAFAATAGLTDLDNPGPAVTSVAMRQRYPWNGFVDVDVSFEGKSGETYRIELSATDKVGGTNLPVRTAWLEGVASVVGNPVDVPAPGTHRLVWNAGADLPAGFVADRVTVTAKLLNPIWSFESIPEIDPNDVWAPATVYHDVQAVAAYGEIEDHEPTVRCLTDEWHLEDTIGSNVVFSGSSMGLRLADAAMRNRGVSLPIALWAHSDSTNAYRMVTMDYETGVVAYDSAYAFSIPGSDLRFFSMRDGGGRAFADLCRDGAGDVFLKSANTDFSMATMDCRYADAEHGSAVCGYFPNGIPWSDAASTSISSYDKGANAAVFFSGEAGTDMKEAIVLCGGSAGVRTTSKYSCMANPVGRYVVPLLDGNKYFTVGHLPDRACAVQHFVVSVGRFSNFGTWDFSLRSRSPGYHPSVCWSKGVAMPDGERIFLGGAGRNYYGYNGSVRMWQGSDALETHAMYPYGHPFESWARRDVTCLLPNGKFCGVDEELGLVVVNPLTGETYVASDNPAFKKGKMGCQLLPNGKVWIIPYDCEGREFLAGTNLCGKLYEVDFGFTRSFSLSSLCSPYLRVAEGDPEPSGIKVGLDPNGGEMPGIYAMYYKGENPVYGELPVPTWTGHTFLGWSTDGTAANLVAATDPVPPLGILLKAAWQANGYSVKFNANTTGSTGSMSNESFVYGTAKALTANAFLKTGYRFAGWARTATGTKAFNDKQTVSNLTATAGAVVNLYALWSTNTYTVRFNKNASDATGTMANQGFTYDRASALRANSFARTGYTFSGWATSASGAKVYNDKQSVSNLTATHGATVDLYAVWTANSYSVKFNTNTTGTTGSMSNESFVYGTAKALTANAFSKTGYRFAGWARTATGTKAFNDKQTVSNLTATAGAVVNLYALWSTNTYTVRFNKNASDATGTMANQGFTYDRASALRANSFARTGYTFSGWATSATGAKVYNDKQSVSNLTATHGATVDLYAVWTASTPTDPYMVVDLSGGANASSYPVSYLSAIPSGGWTDEYKTTKMVLRRIEPGTFTMGSPSGEVGRDETEIQHSVTLTKPYYIGVFEVTQRQYELVTGARPSVFYNNSYYAKRPVDTVSYNDIRGSSVGGQWPSSTDVDSTSFMGKLRSRAAGFRWDLPTEAQWEYACRAGTTTALNSGANLSSSDSDSNMDRVGRYWYNGGSGCYTEGSGYDFSCGTSAGSAAVGSYRVNNWGLYDMHGNVWEFTLDWYGNVSSSSATDPVGPSSGTYRVVKGGGWGIYAGNCRSATRYSGGKPYATNRSVGFRTVVHLDQWTADGYTVHFDKNASDAIGSMSDQTFSFGVAQNLRMIGYSRTGYTFDGWATSPGAEATYRGGASVVDLTSTPGAVVTLYAVWARNNYTVRFNANGGSGTMADQAFKYSTAQSLRANSFTRSGYSFSGWATSASGAKVYNDKQSVNNLATAEGAVVNLYAVWTSQSNNWYIQFHANGGSGTMANETFQFGVSKAISANSFTRSGYTFVGWAAGPSGSVKWEARESVVDLTSIRGATVHLYAVWFPNGYAETFHDGFECSQNPWTTSSYSPWTFETTSTAYDTDHGSDIASSGQLSGFDTSWAQTTGIVGPCTLRFHYRKDFANGTFSVLCDGSSVFSDSTAARSSTWIGKEISIPSGTHTIRVQFTQTSGTAYNGVDVDNLYIVYDIEMTQ